MSSVISPLAVVDPQARIGANCWIGPFSLIGSQVTLGDNCRLDSHVTITGRTTIGDGNRFFPGCVIGGEPQDISYTNGDTQTLIGHRNQFREGVTINRGADKEDGCTRIGNHNLLMANAHVAHNCQVFDRTILVNGVLLGGHVHVQDRAIISGNTVVHHYATIGTLAFVSGGCRVPHDIPPYLLAAGSDNPTLKTINLIGLRRAGLSETTIRVLRQAFRLLFREHKSLAVVRTQFTEELEGVLPMELMRLLNFIDEQSRGKMGRAREAVHAAENQKASEERRAG